MGPFLTAVTMTVVVGVTSLLGITTATFRHVTGIQNTPFADKSVVLLDKLKKNLRRNNDDYITERLRKILPTKLALPYTTFVGLTAATAGKSATVGMLLDNVRHFTELPSNTSPTFFRSNTRMRVPKRVSNKKAVSESSQSGRGKLVLQGITTKSIVTDNQRASRSNKWKQLLEKSKRLREYTSSSKIMLSTAVRDDVKILRTDDSNVTNTTRKKSLHAIFEKRLAIKEQPPPNAEQLDMAPARGSYINNLRAKGRFCHRHVLWPEGPKYDSSGVTMMPMFHPRWYNGRDFAETLKPRFVLPRCCNCCKKSVLGCQ